MRKSILTFAIVILLCLFLMPFAPLISYADESATYYMAKEDIILYDYNEDLSPLCIIPATYYLKKDGEGLNEYHNVIYSGIQGRVLKSKTSSEVTTAITNPYYVSYLLMSTSREFILVYNTPAALDAPRYYTDPTIAFKYIGHMEDADNDRVWYYVSYKHNTVDYRGYILSTDTNNPEAHSGIPIHPLSEEKDDPTNPVSPISPSPEEPTNNLLRVLLILGITIPAIIVVFLLFKPSGKNHPRPHRRPPYDDYDDYYEDDYYYDDYRNSRRDYRRRR